jgi:hypothetical protein
LEDAEGIEGLRRRKDENTGGRGSQG